MSYNKLFSLALSYFDQGNFDAAEALLRQILETAPSQPDVLNLLGLTAQAKGLHSEACSYFAAAIRINDTNPAFFYNIAFSLKVQKQYAEALVNFNKVLKMAPQVKETHNEIACIYEDMGRISEAREHWVAALKLDHMYLTAEINLANSYRLDNMDKAKTDLLNILEKYPDEVLALYDLACLFYEQKEYEKAKFYAQKADSLTSSDSIKCLLGQIEMLLENEENAFNFFQEAEKINPYNFTAKLCVADILSRKNCFDEAEGRYKRLIELDYHAFAPHHNYAEMLYRQHRLTEALEEYRQAVIIAPSSAEVNNNLGVVLKDLKEYDEALGLFFNALSLNSKMEAISVNIAETLILMSADDEEKARKIAVNWLKNYPDNLFATHINSALQGEKIENNKIYTERLFDNFADNYEMVMQNLDYSAPLAIGRVAGFVEGRIVDLGCGSGLVGEVLKNDRNQIIGVDLSAAMLQKAQAKNIYDELVKADIFEFLSTRNDFDWVVASDVLGYIGALDTFFQLCRNKKLIFTIETLEIDDKYQIFANGRFKHSPAYVENLLRENGFCDIYKEELVLRTEDGKPVNGCLFKAL